MSLSQNYRQTSLALMMWAEAASVAELTDPNTYVGFSGNELEYVMKGIYGFDYGIETGGVATGSSNPYADWQGG